MLCIFVAFIAVLLFLYSVSHHLISAQSLDLGGRRGTTDDAATIPFQPSMSSAALRESPNPIPVHSLMLSSHLFFCLPLLLAPFTVPCRIVFAMPEDLEMWPYHLSFHFFTMVMALRVLTFNVAMVMSSLSRSLAPVAHLSFPPWCPTGNAVVVPGRDRSGMDILSFVAVIGGVSWAYL